MSGPTASSNSNSRSASLSCSSNSYFRSPRSTSSVAPTTISRSRRSKAPRPPAKRRQIPVQAPERDSNRKLPPPSPEGDTHVSGNQDQRDRASAPDLQQ